MLALISNLFATFYVLNELQCNFFWQTYFFSNSQLSLHMITTYSETQVVYILATSLISGYNEYSQAILAFVWNWSGTSIKDSKWYGYWNKW